MPPQGGSNVHAPRRVALAHLLLHGGGDYAGQASARPQQQIPFPAAAAAAAAQAAQRNDSKRASYAVQTPVDRTRTVDDNDS